MRRSVRRDVARPAPGGVNSTNWSSPPYGQAISRARPKPPGSSLPAAPQVFGPAGNLREIQLGEWDGLPRDRVRQSHPDLWRARGEDLAGFRPPGGESFRDVQERVVPRVTRIAAETPGDACIVTHAGVIRVLICHVLQMPLTNLFRIRLDYGSVSIISYSPERVEVCALNLRPSNLIRSPGGEIGGPA